MEATPFSFSLFPEIEEHIREELQAIYQRQKQLDSASIQINFTVDTLNGTLTPEVRTTFPASKRKMPFSSHGLLREDGTFKLEKPTQKELFKKDRDLL